MMRIKTSGLLLGPKCSTQRGWQRASPIKYRDQRVTQEVETDKYTAARWISGASAFEMLY